MDNRHHSRRPSAHHHNRNRIRVLRPADSVPQNNGNNTSNAAHASRPRSKPYSPLANDTHHRRPSAPHKPSHRATRHPARTTVQSGGSQPAIRTSSSRSSRKRSDRRPPPRRGKSEVQRQLRRKDKVPPVEPGVLRIIPLGGYEEIGRNMTAVEYGEDIVIVDAGLEFGRENPGIDYIIPDVTYLENHKEKIRGLFITHGHYDHIGAIPHIMERIGNPPIYTREFGALVIQKRQVEFTDAPPLRIRTVHGKERIPAGNDISVRFFEIEHAIRDSMGIIVETPVGNVVIITDVRVDHIDGIPTPSEVEHYAFFKDEKVLLFMLDSTSIEYPGFSTPESEAVATVGKIINETRGRLIIATFASQVERVMQFISIANAAGKKVVVDGRSMKGNVEILKQLDLIKTKNIIPIEEMQDYPPEKVVVIATGAQGEEYSVFDRIANGTHRFIKLSPSDTIIFSSSVIVGNELAVQKLKDRLYRTGAKIITYRETAVHASGHGRRGELEWIHEQINYKFFMPMHGHHYMLRIHAEAAELLGTHKENILVADNGSIVEITEGGTKIGMRKEKTSSDPIMVDGFSIGGSHEVVLRDRQTLAEDGIFVVVMSVNPQTGKLRKSPDIISRGFVYLKEQHALIEGARALARKSVEKTARGMKPVNFDMVKTEVTDDLRRYLLQKTGKSPIVIPVVIGI